MQVCGFSSGKSRVQPWRDVVLSMLTLCAMFAFLSVRLNADQDEQQKVASAAKLVQGGQLGEAESLVWGVLTRDPDNAEALNLLGYVRLRQKRLAESETLLRRAITLSPKLLPAYITLARLFHAQDDTDKEIAALLDASRLAPGDAQIHCDLAAAYLKRNDYRQALDSLQQISGANPPDVKFLLLATTYLGLGRTADVDTLTPTIMSRGAKDPKLLVQFAEVLLDFDLTSQALYILETAQKKVQHPSAALLLTLGRAHERRDEYTLAERELRQALRLDSRSVDILQALARVLARQGQWEKSLELLVTARKLDPNSPEVLRKLAATSLHTGAASQAVEAAQALVKLGPNDPDALYLLGVAQLQNGESEQARTNLESYAKLRPQDGLAFLALAMAEIGLRDLPAAEANLQQSIKLDPNRAEAYYQLSLIFRERGDNSAAITQLQKAVAVNNQYAPAHAVLGALYLSLQQYDKAQEHLMHAVALAPDTADTHYQLGLLFARLNQRDRAQREMEQFRKLKDKGNSDGTPAVAPPATFQPAGPPS
jgi:tetratricopeptide (TPR) repeat protein